MLKGNEHEHAMMWEEHPEFQKQQARLIAVLLLFVVIFYVVAAIATRDWDLLEQVLLYTGAFVIAFGLLFSFVWVLMKIFTRKRRGETKIEDSHKRA
jgi:hypothetical protein